MLYRTVLYCSHIGTEVGEEVLVTAKYKIQKSCSLFSFIWFVWTERCMNVP